MTERIVSSYLANGELPAWPDGQQPRFLQIKMPNTTVFRLRVRFDFRIRIQESAKKRENKYIKNFVVQGMWGPCFRTDEFFLLFPSPKR